MSKDNTYICSNCTKESVCRYADDLLCLVEILSEYKCKYFQHNNIINSNIVDILDKNNDNNNNIININTRTLDTKINNIDDNDDIMSKVHTGKCSICGNNGNVVTCSICGKDVCMNCVDLIDAISNDGEAFNEENKFVCTVCDEFV